MKNQYDYEDEGHNLINGYYLRINPTFPGISYSCRSTIKPRVDLWFRIEIGRKIVAGFVTPLEEKYHGMQVSVQELQGVLNGLDIKLNGWWVYSEDLQAMDANDSPDFKTFNDAYYDLYDKDKFEKFIENAMSSINRMLSSIMLDDK